MKVLILNAESAITKTGSPYLKLDVTDGTSKGQLHLWATGKLTPDDVQYQVLDGGFSISEEFNSISYSNCSLYSRENLDESDPLRQIKTEGYISAKDLYLILKRAQELPMPQVWRDFLSSKKIKDICKMYENYPAGLKIHHSWWSKGLTTHVGEALEAYIALAHTPQCKNLKHHVVVTAIFFHDFGKCYEYSNANKSITDMCPLFGHVYLSTKAFVDISKEWEMDPRDVQFTEHCILAHHGKLEHGSPVVPAISEAFYVYVCDLISARQSAFENAFHMERNYGLGTTVVKQ